MEAIIEEKYLRGNVQIHLAAWPLLPKEETPQANMIFFTVRITDAKQRTVEEISVSCRVLDYLVTTEDGRRQIVSNVLSRAITSCYDGDSVRFLEQQLFLFSNVSAGVVADYYRATGTNCGGVHILVGIGPRIVEEYEDDDDDDERVVVSIDDEYRAFFLHIEELDRKLVVECL